MKLKYLLFTFAMLFGTLLGSNVFAQTSTIELHAFVRDDCGHCHDLEAFLDDIQDEHPELSYVPHNLADDGEQALFVEVADTYGLQKGTPIVLVGNSIFQGFDTADTTGKLILDLLEQNPTSSSFADIVSTTEATVLSSLQKGICTETSCEYETPSFSVRIPLINKTIDTGSMSLSAIALILGFVDGFNPCALWVLIMFLLILMQIGSRKRMWQYAGLFILAEAIMYYLILNVWFTAWDFIAINAFVTPLVALLALGSGTYFMYKFFTWSPVCKVASPKQQKNLTEKVKRLAAQPLTIPVALGILGLAFSVNVFEFACSIGIPQTFTKILELNLLTGLERQYYMFLYIIMYMVDDVFVFGLALAGAQKLHLAQKYSKWTTLLGALMLFALGLIMLFNPELLVF